MRIAIPAGINDGEMIRLAGGGEAVPGGTPGDLYVKVHVEPHPVFRKEGANLAMDLNVKLSDALLGATYTISTLSGDIKLKIPAGVRHGELLRVKGKGVSLDRHRRGDLLVHIVINLPQKLSKSAQELVKKLRAEGI